MKRLLTFLFALCAITMAQAQDVTISSEADLTGPNGNSIFLPAAGAKGIY